MIPAAVAAIRRAKRPAAELLNSVEMAEQPIPVSDGRVDHSVWGVATWNDVDPRIDFFSVYVGGLTNAYRWEDVAGRVQGRAIRRARAARSPARCCSSISGVRATSFCTDEREIRYGVPLGKADLYDVADGVAYRWVYR